MVFFVNIRGLSIFKLIQKIYIGCNYDNKLLCFLYAFIDGFIGSIIKSIIKRIKRSANAPKSAVKVGGVLM
jgi:hypothetical protein